MGREFWEAPEVQEFCEEKVIPEWHEELGQFEIAYLFVDSMKKRGRLVGAKIKKASPVEYLISRKHIILVVNHEVWKPAPTAYRLALMDHEFHHLEVVEDDAGRPTIQPVDHDIEEFNEVLRKHGAWDDGVRAFLEVAEQLELPLSPAVKKAAKDFRDSIPPGHSVTLKDLTPGSDEGRLREVTLHGKEK